MKSYQYEQLDADAKAYLRFVRDGKGRGSPGVFLPFKSKKPTWALIVGLLVMALFLWIGYTSTKAGWAVALLQTAGVLLGGWMVVFAFRRWLANPDKYAGHFVYFDPEHVFYGMGEEIQIAKVGRDPTVEPRGENLVRFDTERGAFTVPALSRVLAQYVTDYYEALKWVRSRNEGRWVDLTSAEAGAVARYLVEEDREPNTLSDTGLEVEEIPNQVSVVSGPSMGLLRYLTVLGAGVGIYALFAFTNPAILDDAAFERAKAAIAEAKAHNANPAEKPENKGFTGAYALRDYLLNPKHTRHRDEAFKLLAELYTGPIRDLKNLDGVDSGLRDEVISILEDVKKLETPAISIRISLWNSTKNDYVELGGDEDDLGNRDRGKQVRSLFADGFATAVGKDLVVCGEAPKGKNAHIEVKYRNDPLGSNTFSWRVEVRTNIEQAQGARGSGTVQVGQNFNGGFGGFGGALGGKGQPAFENPQRHRTADGDEWTIEEPLKNVLGEDNSVYQAVMNRMVGKAPPPPRASE